MSEVRKYIWIMPFIGSIITAISLFTPAIISRVSPHQLIFMNGFYLYVGGGYPVPGYLSIPSLMIVGISCFILILVCTIILFISPLTHRGKETPGSWIALGILLIGGTIIYIAGMELGFFIYSIIHMIPPVSIWAGSIPSFAVVGPFIGGGLSILGYIIGKTAGVKEEVEIKPISKAEPVEVKEEHKIMEEVTLPASEPVVEHHIVNFCPVCGEKVPDIEAKFCPGCGYNLKSE